ncbi:hypothetical protein INP83_06455 [Mucilaginibacter sp. 21P]|uniref:hypothetical protein n=1 Tax=Mucilaginibacter sp. 21P TaxID=2778902 RepID=UPI001C571750|nr:hypothetical protein [Mucilaginibacter sp. 21P]QXV66721.1 hypothetical protein INP83_06455 [Mucilaginibacter sp. 21P]
MPTNRKQLQKRIKLLIWMIIIGLALNGITAFPIETELAWLSTNSGFMSAHAQHWLNTVYNAVKATNAAYPYLSYGTDWLAFAHLLLAVLFIGPLRDPVKNIWIIQFGIIASIAIFPLAFIAGSIRHIPFFWRLIDCSFGVICLIPLLKVRIYLKQLDRTKQPYATPVKLSNQEL